MLQIGDLSLSSRLILGTGKYPSFETMQACHQASQTELVTVAIRRTELGSHQKDSILGWIDQSKIALLPTTAGCYSVDEAVITARLARELLQTNLLKLEVIGDPKTDTKRLGERLEGMKLKFNPRLGSRVSLTPPLAVTVG